MAISKKQAFRKQRFPVLTPVPYLFGRTFKTDDNGGIEVGGSGQPRSQASGCDDGEGLGRLVLARLDEQVPVWRQPTGRRGGDPPNDVQSVDATVQSYQRLV